MATTIPASHMRYVGPSGKFNFNLNYIFDFLFLGLLLSEVLTLKSIMDVCRWKIKKYISWNCVKLVLGSTGGWCVLIKQCFLWFFPLYFKCLGLQKLGLQSQSFPDLTHRIDTKIGPYTSSKVSNGDSSNKLSKLPVTSR